MLISIQDVLEALKTKVTEKIQEGRVMMGLDMIVRTPNGEQADETNTNAIPLYQMVNFCMIDQQSTYPRFSIKN